MPEEISVDALERGARPSNEHVRLGPHLAILDGGAFHYWLPKGKKKEDVPVTDETKITTLFYPIVSIQHPLARGADPHQEAYTVLIKTTQYSTLGEVSRLVGESGFVREEELSGLIINVIDPLTKEDEGLLRDAFPKVDVANILVIESRRKPLSRTRALAYLVGSLALVLGVVGGWVHGLFRAGRDHMPSPASPSLAPVCSARPAPGPAWSQPPAPPRSLPPQPSYRPSSMPPPSHPFVVGQRVKIQRASGAVFGAVTKVQPGQIYVELDSGPKVWVEARAAEPV